MATPGAPTGTSLPQTGEAHGAAPTAQPQPAEQPALHYLLALVISGLVVGLSFFLKEERTKWICVAIGCVMVLTVLFTFAKDMAGAARRRR